jgi:SAM-dependent methyltransferase
VTLIEEYERQNGWREWERYLDRLPLKPGQTVFDLGCATGAVTRLLARRAGKAVGFDNNALLLDEARRRRTENVTFISGDIGAAQTATREKCDGIWISFALAYMGEPEAFISNWMTRLKDGGWFAAADIDGLFSGHLPKDSGYRANTERFEAQSESSRTYDFRIGRKIKRLMACCGLDIIVEENDWRDRELNFVGAAPPEIARSWEARLDRMVSLKAHFGARYGDFCREFLQAITRESHASHGCVRYVVGIKTS